MKHFAYGKFNGQDVICIVTDLNEFINCSSDSMIFCTINDELTQLKKNDIEWSFIEDYQIV